MPRKNYAAETQQIYIARTDKVISIKDLIQRIEECDVKEARCISDEFGGEMYMFYLPATTLPVRLPGVMFSVLHDGPRKQAYAKTENIEWAEAMKEFREMNLYVSRKLKDLTQNIEDIMAIAVELAVIETSLGIQLQVLKAIGINLEIDLLIERVDGKNKLRYRYSLNRKSLNRQVIGTKGRDNDSLRFRHRAHFLRVARQTASKLMNTCKGKLTRAALACEMYPKNKEPESEFADDLKRYEVSFKEDIKQGLKKGAF